MKNKSVCPRLLTATDIIINRENVERVLTSQRHFRTSDCSIGNAVLETEIFCRRCLKIKTPLSNNISCGKFGNLFTDRFRNKCAQFYQDTFRFGISIAHCLGVYFFSRTQCRSLIGSRRWRSTISLLMTVSVLKSDRCKKHRFSCGSPYAYVCMTFDQQPSNST